jgi:hypothetical protein
MIRLIHFFHCLIKKYNKYRRLGAVYCSAVWRAREQLLSALYRGNYWGRVGLWAASDQRYSGGLQKPKFRPNS